MKLIRYQHSLRLVPYAKMRRCRRTKCMSAIILVIFIVAIYKGNHRLIRRKRASKPEYSKRGFIMSRKEEKSFQIHNIAEYLLKPWQRNDTNIQEMRSNMNEYVDFSLAVATKENMEIGQRVKMYFESKDISIDIDEETYNTFPKQWPRDSNHPQYRTCSLVGSSGILSDSQCGKQIDSADYVIRMNVPPIQNYTSDAGFKSNMTTMNPSVVSKRYNNLTLEADIVTFLRDMRQYNQDLLVPALSMKVGYDLTMNVVKAFKREPNHPLHLLLMHPKHFLAMSHFWKDKFDIDAKRISSGLYMTSFALSICDEVTAYGFWPFHTDHRNRTLEYHYYEKSDSVPLPKVHHFAQEYRILLGLHETGVLRLHPNTCS